jgi:hypothetical protein
MGWQSLIEEVKIERKAEGYQYVKEAIEQNGVDVVEGVDDLERLNDQLYLEQFFDKKDDKTFYRTVERVKNDELEYEALRKAIPSMLTHLNIEREHDQNVPNSVFERAIDWVESVHESPEDVFELIEQYV